MLDRFNRAALRKIKTDDGQIFVLAAFSLTILLGFIAFATDLGIMLHEKRVLQTAADSAAIAGAAQLGSTASRPGGATPCNTNNNNCWYYAAIADAAQNGVSSSEVTASNPPTSGPSSGNNSYVQVIVTQSQPAFFMKLFNISSMNVSARAVATNTPRPTCLYTLNTSGVNISSGGGTSLSLPYCSIMDASTSNPSITTNGGGSVSAPSIYLPTGGGVSGNVTTPTQVSASTITDPLAGTLTAPIGYTCGAMPNRTTIGPSTANGVVCYNGMSFSSGTTITLNPGTYVVNGNFKTTGGVNINGSGVTLYMLNGSLSIGGSGTITLSPPGVGSAYNNVVIYQPSSNTSTISFGGTGNANISGIIYAKTAPVSLGGSGGGNLQVDFIIGSISLSGNSTLNPYVPLYGGPLTDARLVE